MPTCSRFSKQELRRPRLELYPRPSHREGRDHSAYDVTSLPSMMRQVPQSAMDIHSVINMVPAFVWYASPDGAIEFLNQRGLAYTGFTSGTHAAL
jgi:hypothetical protein